MEDQPKRLYRQRFTPAGWVGLAMFVICPFVLWTLIQQKYTARYSYQEPSEFLIFLAGLGSMISPSLLLIGREHFLYTRPEPDASALDALDDDNV